MMEEPALSRVLRQFARTMAGGYEMTDVLYELSDNVIDVLGAAAAGIALCDDDLLKFVTATSDEATEAERTQEQFQSGPCYTSLEQDQPVPVRDIRRHHDDWPEFCDTVERVGYLAALGIPLVLDHRRVGSLNVYDAEPRDWTERDLSAGLVLADIGAAYVLNASELQRSRRTTAQLQIALDSRVVIEQAKGKMSGELGINPDEAFDLLRRHARSTNATLRATAQDVLDHGWNVISPGGTP